MSWETKDITLKHPVKIDDAEVNSVQIVMPNGKRLREINKVERTLMAEATAAGLVTKTPNGSEVPLVDELELAFLMFPFFAPDAPEGLMDEMHADDIEEVQKGLAAFLSPPKEPTEG